jgi:hypothetical protein
LIMPSQSPIGLEGAPLRKIRGKKQILPNVHTSGRQICNKRTIT